MKYLNVLNVCCFDYGLKRLFISRNIKSWNLELNNSNNKHFCCEMVWNILYIVSRPKPIPSVLSLGLIYFQLHSEKPITKHLPLLIGLDFFFFYYYYYSYEETRGLQKCFMCCPMTKHILHLSGVAHSTLLV